MRQGAALFCAKNESPQPCIYTMDVPVDVWILIAGDDARVWNTLVRAVPGLHTQELVKEMKEKFGYVPNSNQHRGKICGLMHTSLEYCRVKDDFGDSMDVIINYGLVSGGEHRPALVIDTPQSRLKIYATKGTLTRLSGPALMSWGMSRRLVIDIYLVDGDITKINLLDFSNAYIAMLTTLSPNKNTDNLVMTFYKNPHRDAVHQKYPQNSIEEIVESLFKISDVVDNCSHAKKVAEYVCGEVTEALDNASRGSVPGLEWLPGGVSSFFDA